MAELAPKTINELPEASSLSDSDLFAISSGGTSKKTLWSTIKNAVSSFINYSSSGFYGVKPSTDQILAVNPSTNRMYLKANNTESYYDLLPYNGTRWSVSSSMSFPFTATADGIIMVRANPTSGDNKAYVYISDNGNAALTLSNDADGMLLTGVLPVIKSHSYAISYSSNVDLSTTYCTYYKLP